MSTDPASTENPDPINEADAGVGEAGKPEPPPKPSSKPSAPATPQAPGEKALGARLAGVPHIAAALIASFAFALSFGLNYGIDNQSAYMLGALRLLDPSVLAKDWYALGPGNYHPAFAYIGWLLLALDRGGFWVGAALIAVVTAGTMCFYWLASILYERRIALASFLFFLALAFITRTYSIAVTYAFDFILQPSTLGSVFLIAAIPPFVAGRFFLSGIFLGLSGLFHANYLMLGIATFGLAQLALGKKDLRPRLLHQLGPAMLVFLLLLKLILRSVASPDGAAAQDILFNVRSPHHYAPLSFKSTFFSIAAWQMLGMGAGAWLLRGNAGKGKKLGALIFAFGALLWIGTALTTIFPIQRVTQLFVWRFAPYHSMLLGLLFCAAAVHIATKPSLIQRIPPSSLALTLAGIVSVGLTERLGQQIAWALLTTLLPALIAVALWFGKPLAERFKIPLTRVQQWLGRRGVWLVLAVSAVACFRVGKSYVKSFRTESNLLNKSPNAEKELYAWVRANTPKDALFLTPPSIEGFRLWGERAIVADWKGSPYAPSDVLEWYHRLEDISGRPNFRKRDDVFEGYANLDEKRVLKLRDKYKFDYVVIQRGREQKLPGKVIYQNARFSVIELPG